MYIETDRTIAKQKLASLRNYKPFNKSQPCKWEDLGDFGGLSEFFSAQHRKPSFIKKMIIYLKEIYHAHLFLSTKIQD
jgi:hypothetical protein